MSIRIFFYLPWCVMQRQVGLLRLTTDPRLPFIAQLTSACLAEHIRALVTATALLVGNIGCFNVVFNALLMSLPLSQHRWQIPPSGHLHDSLSIRHLRRQGQCVGRSMLCALDLTLLYTAFQCVPCSTLDPNARTCRMTFSQGKEITSWYAEFCS